MAFAYIQSGQNVGTNTIAFSTNNTAGNIIIAANADFGVTLSTACTDSQGNTYTKFGVVGSEMVVYVATSIAAGANTVTFAGAAGGNTSYIVAEYSTPASYLIYGDPQTNAPSSWVINVIGEPVAFASSAILLVPIGYNHHVSATYSLSTGTVRQTTSEPGGESLFLADVIFSPVGLTSTTTVTVSASALTSLFPLYLIAVGGTGTGGGATKFIREDMSGGMFG